MAFSGSSSEVNILRRYRDDILSRSSLGAELIDFYYKTSPPLAKWIAQSKNRIKIAKLILIPVVRFAEKTLKEKI